MKPTGFYILLPQLLFFRLKHSLLLLQQSILNVALYESNLIAKVLERGLTRLNGYQTQTPKHWTRVQYTPFGILEL